MIITLLVFLLKIQLLFLGDDTQNLQSLVSKNDIIILGDSSKIYNIYGTVFIPNNKVIKGTGAKIYQHQSNSPIFEFKNKKNITIEGLKLYGHGNDYAPSSSSTAVGINCYGSQNIKIYSNVFSNFSNTGILGLREVKKIKILNNKFIGTGLNNSKFYQKDHTGITLGGENIQIIGNDIRKTSQGIMIAERSDSIFISKNYIHDIVLEHGIYVDTSCNNIKILENRIIKVGGSGIKIQNRTLANSQSKNILIEKNVVSGTKIGDGILVYNIESGKPIAEDVSITNNKLDNIGQHGINIRETKNCIVKENKINGCAYAGLYLRNNNHLQIVDNEYANLQENGIFDEGSGEDYLIKNNIFTNVGISGNFKNGRSSGIFMEGGKNRTIQNNKITGSNEMQHALYIANGDLKTISVTGNNFNKVKENSIRINGDLGKMKDFKNNATK